MPDDTFTIELRVTRRESGVHSCQVVIPEHVNVKRPTDKDDVLMALQAAKEFVGNQ